MQVKFSHKEARGDVQVGVRLALRPLFLQQKSIVIKNKTGGKSVRFPPVLFLCHSSQVWLRLALILFFKFRLVLLQVILACVNGNQHAVAAAQISAVVCKVSHLVTRTYAFTD